MPHAAGPGRCRGRACPRQDQQKRGDGKLPPYGGPVIDGLGSRTNLLRWSGFRRTIGRAVIAGMDGASCWRSFQRGAGNCGRRAENRMSVGDGFHAERIDSTEVKGRSGPPSFLIWRRIFCSSRLLSSQFSLCPTTSYTTIVGYLQFMDTLKPRNWPI